MFVSFLTYSSILKIQAILSSETSVNFHRITGRYIPGGRTLHSHRCEDIKSSLNAFVGRKEEKENISRKGQEEKCILGFLNKYTGSPAYSCIRFYSCVFLFICRRVFIDLYFHQIFRWFFGEKFYI
jgi:hypothetical protein